jgi:hypothetical protein
LKISVLVQNNIKTDLLGSDYKTIKCAILNTTVVYKCRTMLDIAIKFRAQKNDRKFSIS